MAWVASGGPRTCRRLLLLASAAAILVTNSRRGALPGLSTRPAAQGTPPRASRGSPPSCSRSFLGRGLPREPRPPLRHPLTPWHPHGSPLAPRRLPARRVAARAEAEPPPGRNATVEAIAAQALEMTGDALGDALRRELSEVVELAEGLPGQSDRLGGAARRAGGEQGVPSSSSSGERRTVRGRTIAEFRRRISSMGREGKWEAALEALHELRNLGGQTDKFMYHAIISSMLRELKAGDHGYKDTEPLAALTKILSLAKLMKSDNVQPDGILLATVISFFAQAPMGTAWSASVRLVDKMGDIGITLPDMAYTSVFSACASAWPPRWEAALRIAQRVRGREPLNTQTSNALLSALAKAGEWKRAFYLVSEMEEAGSPSSEPDSVTYTNLIRAYGQANMPDEALGVLQTLLEKEKHGLLERDPDLLEMAKKREGGVSSSSSSSSSPSSPSSSSPSSLSSSQQRHSRGPSFITLCVAIRACRGDRGRRWADAVRLYAEALARAPGVREEEEARRSVVSALAAAGQWERAEKIFREHRTAASQRTYEHLLEAYARAGVWQGALALAGEMEARGCTLNAHVYRWLIASCNPRKKWRKALEILGDMRGKMLRPGGGVVGQAVRVFRGFRGSWRRALWLAGLLENDKEKSKAPPASDDPAYGHDDSAYPAYAEPSAEIEGELEGWGLSSSWSVSPFPEMETLRRGVQEAIHSGDTSGARWVYHSLLALCDAEGAWSPAYDLFNQMRTLGVRASAETYDRLIAACARAGRPDAVMSALQKMREDRLRITPKMYSGVVAAYAKRGNWEGATLMLTRLREKGVPAEISGYNAAMQALASGFQWRGAIQLLSQLEGAGLYPGYQTYDALISVCEMCGQWEKAMSFYERMERELDDEEFERRSSRRASRALDEVQMMSSVFNTTTMLRAFKGDIPGFQLKGMGERSIETIQREAAQEMQKDDPFWDV